MALLTVLWAIAIMTMISAIFTTTIRTEINRTRNLVENGKAEGVADAGVYRAIAALLNADTVQGPRLDGTAYKWQFDGAEVRISIQSEAGKIDLNTGTDELLEGLFVSVGIEAEKARRLVDAMRDFTDKDDMRREFGAEDAEYRAAGLRDGAKDGPFNDIAELQQVLGMTPELYDKVAPTVTIYSGGRNIDPTTAPAAALLAIPGTTQTQVDAILTVRGSGLSSEDEATTGDASPQHRSFAFLDEPVSGFEVSGFDVPGAQAVRERLDSVVTITAVAKTQGGGVFERIAVVRLTGDSGQPFGFYEWRQGWPASGAAGNATKEGDAAQDAPKEP